MLVKYFPKLIKLDGIFFKIGLFLLPSALTAAAFLLIISILISFRHNYLIEREDKIN